MLLLLDNVLYPEGRKAKIPAHGAPNKRLNMCLILQSSMLNNVIGSMVHVAEGS